MRAGVSPGRLSIIIAFSIISLSCSDNGPQLPGPPTSIEIISGDGQQGTVAQTLTNPVIVKVVDASGRGVRDQSVTFQTTTEGGTVTPEKIATDANGVAQARWTLGTLASADRALQVQVDEGLGQTPLVATLHASALPGAATALVIFQEPPTAARSGAPLLAPPLQPVQLGVADAYGNLVQEAGVRVAVSIVGGGLQTLSGTTTVLTDTHGRAQFDDLTITGPAGLLTLGFSAPSLAGVVSSTIHLLAQ